MFAIIRTGGKQYKVAPGDTIAVEKLDAPKKEVDFGEVLLLGGDKVLVGHPTVSGASVKAEVLSNFRGEKIRVFKYQAKSHWSRTHGHRQALTQVKIKDIVESSKLSSEGAKRKPKVSS